MGLLWEVKSQEKISDLALMHNNSAATYFINTFVIALFFHSLINVQISRGEILFDREIYIDIYQDSENHL